MGTEKICSTDFREGKDGNENVLKGGQKLQKFNNIVKRKRRWVGGGAFSSKHN